MKIRTDTNIQEIYKYLVDNNNRLLSHEPKADMMWNKALREAKGKDVSIMYEYEIDNNSFCHFRYTCADWFYFVHLIVVPFAKDKYQYLNYLSSSMDIFKYTSHFFDRYKERMKLKGSMRQAVKRFFKQSKSMACIYWKHDQFVYAFDDGLVLGVFDQRLGMKVGCTFVDYGLLKSSQKAAYEKIQTIKDKIRKEWLDLFDRGVSHKDATQVIAEKYYDVSEAAQEIYSWYFEEGDLNLR